METLQIQLCPYCSANGKKATNTRKCVSMPIWKCDDCGGHFPEKDLKAKSD